MAETKENVFDIGLFRRLLIYIRPYRHIFAISFITVIGLSLFGAARPYVLREAIDKYMTVNDFDGFMLMMAIMLGLLFLETICNLLFIFYASWLGQSVVKDIRVKLFKHILKFRMKYFDNSSVGLLITRTVSDMERIADIFSQGLFMIFSDILKMLVVGVFMFLMNWRLSLIVICTLPIVLVATKIFQKYMKRAFEEVRTEVAKLNSFVQERVTGMKILQLFTREKIEYEAFTTINNRHKKAWLKTVWYNSIFFPIAEVLTSLTLGLVVWIGGMSIVQTGNSTPGDLLAFVMYIPMMFRPLNQIANKFNTLQMGMVAADRVFKVLDTDSQISNEGTEIAAHFKGEVDFENVHFSYVQDEEVLRGLDLKIDAGKTVAIVGATGAGKSTIINLLNRFYDINSGSIKIDGTNIQDFTIDSLRAQIALVLQDVFLFADTIMSNITLDNENISEEQVYQAAKDIGIHDFIMSLPGGYQYNVKERGVMLSSGQRQLISFLRAYVTDPSILILDEATSSVDSYSEMLIQEAIEKITANRTSIVIAHRLATVQRADMIIVMDSGKIVEQGTHDELLRKKDGYYKSLYEVQFLQADVA